MGIPRVATTSASPGWRAIARLEPEAVPVALLTAPAGLSREEASRRLALHGPNELRAARRLPTLVHLARQLTHFMAILLWVAGALAFVARMPELGATIVGVVLVNGAFGAWQEHRAERALEALGALLPATARVVRGGAPMRLLARELVPGDVLELRAGDRVPADARVVDAAGLALDLSLLTGESAPVDREAIAADASDLASAACLAPAGSTVVRGRARAVVFATGPATELGRIARLASATPRPRSTLEAQVAGLVRVVTAVAVSMACLVFVVLAAVGAPLHESLLFAIGILVANVPEGLLPTITVTLAGNVQRMARRNALVTRLSAVETLGAVDVVCTDKTGTLTLNAVTVRALWTPGTGERGLDDPSAPVRRLLSAACVANDARLDGTRVEGDPIDAALLRASVARGVDVAALRRASPRVAEQAFDAERRWMSVVVDPGPEGFARRAAVLVKGAPSSVLDRCVAALDGDEPTPLDAAARATVLAAAAGLAARGLRVIAVAWRGVESDVHAPAPERDLALVGLVAFEDPPRRGVAEALSRCRRAGITVTMVSGDQGAAVRAIAEAVGLWRPGFRVVEGPELDALPDAGLDALLSGGAGVVFARVPPSVKLRIVRAYQRLGHVVAVTGDGVNDAPALHAAHVGVAMGSGGTDVARAAADVVLLDDDFSTVVTAIEEGRATFANVRKFLAYVLTSNVPEIVPFLAMAVLRIPPALGILQILAVDLGTDMLPALALGAEPPDPGTMERPPRSRSARLLDAPLLARAYGILGLVEAAFSLGAFLWTWHAAGYAFGELQALTPALLAHRAAPDVEHTYRLATTAALAAIVACQVGNAIACRHEHAVVRRGGANRLLRTAVLVELAMLAALVYAPPLREVFGTAPLPALAWPFVALGAPAVVAADALWKRALARDTPHAPKRSPRTGLAA